MITIVVGLLLWSNTMLLEVGDWGSKSTINASRSTTVLRTMMCVGYEDTVRVRNKT